MTHLDPIISTLVMGLQVEVCEPNLNDTARGNPDYDDNSDNDDDGDNDSDDDDT